jgi:peptide/nickel transport system permease protein
MVARGLKFLIKEIGKYIIIFFIAVTTDFVFPRLVPGGPADDIKARLASEGIMPSPALLHAIYVEMGISNAPIYIQYFQYLDDVFHFNFGASMLFFPESVSKIIEQTLPWTLFLVITATIISFIIGNLLGRYAAMKRKTKRGTAVILITMFLGGIPAYVAGIILIYLFSFDFHLLPAYSSYNLTLYVPSLSFAFILSVIKHAILPIAAIVIISLSSWTLQMRNNIIPLISEDFVNFMRIIGVREKVLNKLVYRNAILPNFTGFAMALGFSVSGVLLIEEVFSYPGIGFYLYEAIEAQDYPLIEGIFLTVILAVLIANFVVDVIYSYLDPRIRIEVE